VARFCEYANEHSISLKGRKFFDRLSIVMLSRRTLIFGVS
jgi:hypothetical protein